MEKQKGKNVVAGNKGDGDCLSDALSYIFTGDTSQREYFREMLVRSGVVSAVYDISGNVAYLNITNAPGFIKVLNSAVKGYRVVGNLAGGVNNFNERIQTLAKIDLGNAGPNGEMISYAVIITGKNPDGSYQYKDVVNNVEGVVPAKKILASITIARD
jgi:hypothetical protein